METSENPINNDPISEDEGRLSEKPVTPYEAFIALNSNYSSGEGDLSVTVKKRIKEILRLKLSRR